MIARITELFLSVFVVMGLVVASTLLVLWLIRDEVRRMPRHECHCRRDEPRLPAKPDRPRIFREGDDL